MRSVFNKEYFTHILLGRLETQDRNSKDLIFFKPKKFKTFYRYGEYDFVNDILVPHMNSLKFYILDKNKIAIKTYKEVDSLIIENNQVIINSKGKEYLVHTPKSKDRNLNNLDDFEPLKTENNDLSKVTIDHNPSLLEYTKNCDRAKYDILFKYNRDSINKDILLEEYLPDKKKKKEFWRLLVKYFEKLEIEMVLSKYNKR